MMDMNTSASPGGSAKREESKLLKTSAGISLKLPKIEMNFIKAPAVESGMNSIQDRTLCKSISSSSINNKLSHDLIAVQCPGTGPSLHKNSSESELRLMTQKSSLTLNRSLHSHMKPTLMAPTLSTRRELKVESSLSMNVIN